MLHISEVDSVESVFLAHFRELAQLPMERQEQQQVRNETRFFIRPFLLEVTGLDLPNAKGMV